jgi:hypothetical protein
MHTFWSYLAGAVIRPRRTFGRLLEDPQHLDHGIAAILFIGARVIAGAITDAGRCRSAANLGW